ncbi:MAG: helix-turn-helix transcriptional regulator [Bacteroidota bacterium]
MSDQNDLRNALDSVLQFGSEKEEIRHGASMISLDIIRTLEAYMDEKGLTKADIAAKIGTSKSYLTQLFSGEKLVNMTFMYRLQKAFGLEFEFGLSNRISKANFVMSTFEQTPLPTRESQADLPKQVYVIIVPPSQHQQYVPKRLDRPYCRYL